MCIYRRESAIVNRENRCKLQAVSRRGSEKGNEATKRQRGNKA
jgi:hypothetical protein